MKSFKDYESKVQRKKKELIQLLKEVIDNLKEEIKTLSVKKSLKKRNA